jgi:ketosteroid isomerase-like protein
MMRAVMSGLFLLSVTFIAPSAALATDRSDVIALVQAYNEAGNRGDRAAYASYCTEDAEVVDHVPPYQFRGPMACADEYDAVVAWATSNGVVVNGLALVVLDPVFFEARDGRAYVVFPVDARFTERGRRQVEKLYLTTVLRREASQWRIESLTYSSEGLTPAAGGEH